MMSTKYKILAGGLLAITLLDSIGSITSGVWDYNYDSLAPVSYLIYAAVGFLTHKYAGSLKSAATSGVLLGLFDVTVGWWLSLALGANSSVDIADLETPVIIIAIIVFPILLGMVAFVGGVLSKVVSIFI